MGKIQVRKRPVKSPTLLDYDGLLPAYVHITDGKTADNKRAYNIPSLKQSIIIVDGFYNDFSLLNVWDSNQIYCVIRDKKNILFKSIKENDLPDNCHEPILKDEIIELTGVESKKKDPGQ